MKDEILKALNQRFATKIFDPSRKLTEEQVETLLETARLTATSYGLQLMKIVLVEDPDLREKLVEHAYGQRQVADASHLLVLCREREITADMIRDYIENIAETRNVDLEKLSGYQRSMISSITGKSKEEQIEWMRNQLYITLGKLLTVCALMEIDSCPMEGFKPEEFDQILGLKEKGLSSVLLLPVGYHAPNDKNAAAKKVRRSPEKFVIKI